MITQNTKSSYTVWGEKMYNLNVEEACSLNTVILYLQGIKPREMGNLSGLYDVVREMMRFASHIFQVKLFYFKVAQ
jgi:hypothetical protein